MATFVLIHGAGDTGWHWHLVEPELRARGHDVVTMDLPCDDDSAGLEEYADAVEAAIGDREDLVLVAQSFGGFTAPLVCERVAVDLMVLVTAMIPSPGETANDYWANTGWLSPEFKLEHHDGMNEDDAWTVAAFMHDVPLAVTTEALRNERAQSETPGLKPWPLDAWPDVPTRFLLCRDDRFFPPDWMRQVVQERLGITPDEIDGSHCVALSRPKELADRLDEYASEL
ncbi:MAG: alpha/beta hydrolase [Actinomycetota bacterium]|nr:alpha/beta hydrolase [Actinomycetota bacterium]